MASVNFKNSPFFSMIEFSIPLSAVFGFCVHVLTFKSLTSVSYC